MLPATAVAVIGCRIYGVVDMSGISTALQGINSTFGNAWDRWKNAFQPSNNDGTAFDNAQPRRFDDKPTQAPTSSPMEWLKGRHRDNMFSKVGPGIDEILQRGRDATSEQNQAAWGIGKELYELDEHNKQVYDQWWKLPEKEDLGFLAKVLRYGHQMGLRNIKGNNKFEPTDVTRYEREEEDLDAPLTPMESGFGLDAKGRFTSGTQASGLSPMGGLAKAFRENREMRDKREFENTQANSQSEQAEGYRDIERGRLENLQNLPRYLTGHQDARRGPALGYDTRFTSTERWTPQHENWARTHTGNPLPATNDNTNFVSDSAGNWNPVSSLSQAQQDFFGTTVNPYTQEYPDQPQSYAEWLALNGLSSQINDALRIGS